MKNRRTPNEQTDCFTDLSLSALSAPMAPTHCYDAKALPALQKSLLGHAPHAVYIYALVDPSTYQIRYIGQTKHLCTRYRGHLYSGLSGISVCRWIAWLHEQGQRPLLCILETTDAQQSTAREICWIRRYADHVDLLNDRYRPRHARQIRRRSTTTPLFDYMETQQRIAAMCRKMEQRWRKRFSTKY